MMDSLGDRIKGYEKTFGHNALKRTPLIVRVDGRAFHSFTRGMNRPFDAYFISAMVNSARCVADEMQGFKVAYVQSDEVTFALTDYDNIKTQGWFDYDLFKVVSISASLMSTIFARYYPNKIPPVFDSRAFSVPRDDVSNVFLWRAIDWERNSIQMYAGANFSHKELQGKNRKDMHDMLHGIGKSWNNDLSSRERNGTFIIKNGREMVERTDILPRYNAIDPVIGRLFNGEGQL